MSGSSLDGIDVALVSLSDAECKLVGTYFKAYPESLKQDLLNLHTPSENELATASVIANTLAIHYADAVNGLLKQQNLSAEQIAAIGCHGQTIRHQPKYRLTVGYSIQLGNHALLTELTGITVVGDFRARDIAAGGEGAPLVPAFHQAVFSSRNCNRVILNIGGIANITYLPSSGTVIGFDTGPGNILIDHWTQLKTGQAYDKNGDWSASGTVQQAILNNMLNEPYFAKAPPKSSGRDLFNLDWLAQHTLDTDYKPQDIARTTTELTVRTICQAIADYCPNTDEVYVCGGGTQNNLLMSILDDLLAPVTVSTTNELGVDTDWVEAAAFAWLASQAINSKTANLPSVTGASGSRILGAIYPN